MTDYWSAGNWSKSLKKLQKLHKAGHKKGMLRKNLHLKAGRKRVD